MANFNFQQPPRSMANATLAGRNSGTFGGNSLSGHVTPTSDMFPIGGGNYGQPQPPQLSPNRNMQLSVSGGGPSLTAAGGRSNIFGSQRPFNQRTMTGLSGGGPMSNMNSFMQTSRGYGSGSGGNALNNFHSVFVGNTGDSSTPALLDLSEFPSLTNARGQNDQSLPQSNPLQPPGSKPYVGMVKQPTMEHSEFQMSNEDFPALPGTQITDGTNNTGSGISDNVMDNAEKNPSLVGGGSGGIGGTGLGGSIEHQNDISSSSENAIKRGVQTSPDGKVTNIPASMVNNQYGMVGLLTFIRAAESDPNLVTLAMGQDLTGLGLNLNSQENLHPTFAGPFADHPCRAQDIEYNVPPEYLINASIRDKLSSLALKKYKDDLLFFLFYTNVGDVMQLAAAAELFNRDWRYHVEEKVWITRIPGIPQIDKNGTKENKTFYYFDAQTWRRVVKDFQVDGDKLDKCPTLSALNGQSV
ncbi:regulator of gene activity [Condylostylus longicornis]|uniref:regulator of gene activity n=1 Tax=Condylostylus longicornis TaxID=2530218 RepID=UPI00244E191F|nr:regulator of gene activity [Condylostylus longicornis]